MRVLFVCNQGMNRSRTAAEMFADEFDTDYAGVYTNLHEEQLENADIVVVMSDHQRKMIADSFPKLYLKKKIISLNINDVYRYNQPELRSLLLERVRRVAELR